LLIDQVAKWAVTYPFGLTGGKVITLSPIFNLRWVPNVGTAMHLVVADGPVARWLLVGMTSLIALGVLVWMWRANRLLEAFALGLVFGGAVSNILDRIRLGHVIDYADLHFGEIRPFLIFNIADAAISIGVLLLVISVVGGPTRAVRP
jgi:signal peptidase II